ncbi:MAG: Ni/Fe hydrogenase subunit alpha [Gammaproteobacteria bacterium]
MSRHLESAAHPHRLRRVVIEPVTRVEGHGKVTLLLDEANQVRQARLHIVEFRGFEKFIQGRPYWELPVVVQRLCGICPVSHHLAAAKAVDRLVGVTELPPAAEKLRRLLHHGQILQSHALHFFHLASPDLLFGFDDAVAHRNLVGLIADRSEIAMQGVKLRKFGQQVIAAIAGKRIHGVAAVPGGMNKPLAAADRDALLRDLGQVLVWAREAVALIKRLYQSQADYFNEFAAIRSNWVSLVRPDGALELYDGVLRARDGDGQILFDQWPVHRYADVIREQVKSWTYMKFPFLTQFGTTDGWYRVGPLARLNNCDSIATPLAEAERREFVAFGGRQPMQSSLAYHWARMVELLHAAEGIEALLRDPDILGTDLRTSGERRQQGIGVIEAPRGTLIHHYQIRKDGLVERANLIVATTHNNQAMNEAIRQVAARYLDGMTLTEPLLNRIEVAIRAYDPCLSCATHALGKMPLQVELVDAEGRMIDRIAKSSGPQPDK